MEPLRRYVLDAGVRGNMDRLRSIGRGCYAIAMLGFGPLNLGYGDFVTRVVPWCLLPLGPWFFAAFLVLCGIQHFIHVPFVVTLVPAWIPGAVFWAYFAGVALIAGGLGLLAPATARLAGLLSGAMISWCSSCTSRAPSRRFLRRRERRRPCSSRWR